jgi:hypothetical protein
MRLIATILACLYLSACAGPPTRPPLGQVLVITGAVILAGAIVEHRQANHLVHASNGVTPPDDPCTAQTGTAGDVSAVVSARTPTLPHGATPAQIAASHLAGDSGVRRGRPRGYYAGLQTENRSCVK